MNDNSNNSNNNNEERNASESSLMMLEVERQNAMIEESDIIIPGSFVVLQGVAGDGISNTIDSFPTFIPNNGGGENQTHDDLEEDDDDFDHVLPELLDNNNNNNTDTTTNSCSETTIRDPHLPLHQTTSGGATATLVVPDNVTSIDTETVSSISNPTATNLIPNLLKLPDTLSNNFKSKTNGTTISTNTNHGIDSSLSSFIVVSQQEKQQGLAGCMSPIPTLSTSATTRTTTSSSLLYSNFSKRQLLAILDWQQSCRKREIQQHQDWISHHQQQQQQPMLQHSTRALSSPQSVIALDTPQWLSPNTWWLDSPESGKLAVFEDLPTRLQSNPEIVITSQPIYSLSPGYTVVGTQLVCLDSTTFDIVSTTTASSSSSSNKDVEDSMAPSRFRGRGKVGWTLMLYITSPVKGYVVLSVDGHVLLGPGLSSLYCDPNVYMWKITCVEGAFVRRGLELQSPRVATLPHGSLIRVSQKTINRMGLARLRIDAIINNNNNQDEANQNESSSSSPLLIQGWISQSLNPLSGQRGPIAQPLPFPLPALYQVTIQEGAVIRSDVELSSPQVGWAPRGTILRIVGKAFSESPSDNCLERLKLAGNGGWVSIRLNREPPRNHAIVTLIDVDTSFDPDWPALYHLQAQKEAQETKLQFAEKQKEQEEQQQQRKFERQDSAATQSPRPLLESPRKSTKLNGNVTSNNDDKDKNNDILPKRPIQHSRTPDSSAAAAAAKCLLCLTEDRNATIVHGQTGHIACCLVCARLLHGRGERCPVCRLPIDLVIQQFWA